ncbi:bifunctional DNA primase/polymerase [Streptomyces sp. NPDC048196]|uniref:bifunctional DNA primase/polymerase n=1 Tax=Streptomyces sp. NPDC048196 TaxID=3154712 RepID=UPI0033E596BF
MTYDHKTALLAAALDAAARGWHVFPLRPGDKRPAVTNWSERATTDRQRITRCWTHAPYNIGIAAGPSALVVIDLDISKGPEDLPPADWATPGIVGGTGVLAALCERHNQPYPTDTHTVGTGSGGTHLYFTAPETVELRNSAGSLGWKIDTRANGGYVVGARSIVAGHPYETRRDTSPSPLPGWLLDLLRPVPLPPQEPVTVTLTTDRRGRWLKAAVDGELARVTGSGDDQHNNALYIASVALGQLVAGGELSESEVTGWLLTAALQVGQGEREALRTIASGLRAGAARPRTVAA